MTQLTALDDHIRRLGVQVWTATPEEIVYFNPHNGNVVVVRRRAELEDWYVDDLCFQLGVPKLSEVPVSPRPRSRRK